MNHKKVPFLTLPTPLEYLPRISEDLGIRLYIKRDDLTPLGAGGNKLRKLEYLLHDAQQKGATLLLTTGGVQTNHGRLTAAVAAKYGLKCAIVCVGEYPDELSANLLLDRLMGAEVYIKQDDGRDIAEQLSEAVQTVRTRHESTGEVVYEIPIGGSNPIGILGYYECAQELIEQSRREMIGQATLCCAVGSLGTYIGLLAGLKQNKSAMQLCGIAIAPQPENLIEQLSDKYLEFCRECGFDLTCDARDFCIETAYTCGGYNNVSEEVRKAIYYMAQRESILLDPCYTGKAFAGLLAMVHEKRITPGETVIFLHTGGMPGLYTKHHRLAFEKELEGGVILLQ